MKGAFDPLKMCPFPEHYGAEWAELAHINRNYLHWLISGEGPDMDPDMEEHIVNLLESTPEED